MEVIQITNKIKDVLVPDTSKEKTKEYFFNKNSEIAVEFSKYIFDKTGFDNECYLSEPKSKPRRTVRIKRQKEHNNLESSNMNKEKIIHIVPTQGGYLVTSAIESESGMHFVKEILGPKYLITRSESLVHFQQDHGLWSRIINNNNIPYFTALQITEALDFLEGFVATLNQRGNRNLFIMITTDQPSVLLDLISLYLRENDLGIKTHSGYDISDECDFFVNPPDCIGRVVTAQTSLKINENPTKLLIHGISNVFKSTIAGLCFGLLLALLIVYGQKIGDTDGKIIVFCMIGASNATIGLVIGIMLTSFEHTCSYVCKEGIAEYKMKWYRNNIIEEKLMQFKDAYSLKYTIDGSHYILKWKNKKNKILYAIEGNYYSQEKALPEDLTDKYYFALSAQKRWNEYKLHKWY